MKNLFLYAILVGVAQPVVAASSLCESAERTVFNCTLRGSSKLVSICASPGLTSATGYLQYRYGRSGKIELAFPKEKNNSQKTFKFVHYLRPQVDRTELNFDNSGYQYTVYSYFDGEEKPTINESGIRVDGPDGKSKNLICAAHPTDQLATLESAVPCDKDNAMSMDCE
jgi:hypothetical protein